MTTIILESKSEVLKQHVRVESECQLCVHAVRALCVCHVFIVYVCTYVGSGGLGLYTLCVSKQCVHSVSVCVCVCVCARVRTRVWTVCGAECLPVYFGSTISLCRYRASTLNVSHLLRAALYMLAEKGLCGQLGHDVPQESIISQRCLRGMGRACNLGNWAKK